VNISLMRKYVSSFLAALLILCQPVSADAQGIPDFLLKIIIKSALPLLEKAFDAEVPVSPSSREIFPTTSNLPGKDFSPLGNEHPQMDFLGNGSIRLLPGDYVIPVDTYCMKSASSSPDRHRYKLAKLHGKQADIIKALNARAVRKYPISEIQHLSWNIQNGVKYEEMGSESSKIVNEVLPEYKTRLSRSFIEDFQIRWDQISNTIPGMPNFAIATDNLLNNLGDLGKNIRAFQKAREDLRRFANDYRSLEAGISLPGLSRDIGDSSTTPWSRIQGNVYGRFMTAGNFNDVGQLQLRVLDVRSAASNAENNLTTVDLTGLVADPGTGNIQPLSFSPLMGVAAVGALTLEAPAILIAGAIMGIYAAQNIDWGALGDAIDKFSRDSDVDVQEVLREAQRLMNERHDQLEKPAREAGVLDDAVETPAGNGKGATRQYDKDGGKEAKDRDFEKFEGTAREAEPGVWVKTLPDGTKIVSRDRSSPPNDRPTVEIQPPKNGGRERIKIRY
jgi:hypothetical protein